MKYAIAFTFLVTSVFCFGQDQRKIDSLQLELSKRIDNKTRLSLLTEIFNTYIFIDLDSAKVYKDLILKLRIDEKKDLIGIYSLSSKYYYYKSMPDSSLRYTKKALEIAVELNDDSLKSDLYRKLAILSSRSDDYKNAENYGYLALESANRAKDWRLIASSSIMLGNQYYKKTDFDLALKYYLNADSLYTLYNEEDRFLANSYDNIGSIYTDLRDEKALEYIEKSKNIYQSNNDEEGIAYTNLLKGTFYNKIGEYSKAITNFEASSNFYSEYGNIARFIESQTRLINAYSKMGDYQNAEKVLFNVEKVIKKSKEQSDLVIFYLNAGQLNIDIKKYDKAINFLKEAENLISDTEYDYAIGTSKEVKKGLTYAYRGKKDYKNALKYSLLHLQIIDSIFKKNSIKITQELETKYQTEKKEQEIALLKSQNELAEQQKRAQRNQLLGGISITSVTGLFFFMLYRNRQKTTRKLRELDKAKSNFFTNISHEFRTPLTLISGPVQKQLKKEYLDDEERQSFEMIQRNSKRLLSLVDQLLDISKLEAGNLQVKVSKASLMPFLGSLCDSFTFEAKQRNINYIKYINETKTTTFFDKDVLEKIVINLVSNALKYTPDKGSIVCNATVKDNKLYFTVKNSGKGLTKQEIAKIFERFYQLNETSEGVGIGLALVKELVMLHKGEITVASTPNEWTTFEVVLPVNKTSFKADEIVAGAEITQKINNDTALPITEEPALNELAAEDKNDENPIVLIVDDNADIRTYVSTLFKKNYTILEAKDGREGIYIAIEQVPDIIISDIMMPVTNGIELCNTLKVDERTSHIPIILLTAKAGEEHEIEGIKTGADDYITKPFNEELLKIRVEKLLESRKKLQQRYSQEVILRPKDIAITPVDEQFLNRMQEILDDKLVEASFSIEAFSKALGMSRMQLHRKLKALTGLSASEFIRSQRLKLAAQLLKKSEINVSQVGYSVGFNDHAYFSKCFKEMYHCTPTAYAKRNLA